MSRRKIEERAVRKLSRNGKKGSFYVTIPVEIIRELDWKSKQKVIVKKQGSKVVVTDY
ncbi:MAG: hypothetical protein ABH832_02260 [bacterium]